MPRRAEALRHDHLAEIHASLRALAHLVRDERGSLTAGAGDRQPADAWQRSGARRRRLDRLVKKRDDAVDVR